MTSRISFIVLFLASLFATRSSDAQNAGGGGGGGQVEVYMQVKPADPSDPKQRGKAPEIEATVVGGSKTTIDKLTLSTMNKGQKVTMKASKLREYTDGTETIAIALVING